MAAKTGRIKRRPERRALARHNPRRSSLNPIILFNFLYVLFKILDSHPMISIDFSRIHIHRLKALDLFLNFLPKPSYHFVYNFELFPKFFEFLVYFRKFFLSYW